MTIPEQNSAYKLLLLPGWWHRNLGEPMIMELRRKIFSCCLWTSFPCSVQDIKGVMETPGSIRDIYRHIQKKL